MKTSTFLTLMVVAGAVHNFDRIERWLNPPPPISQAAANSQVVLYSTTWCGYCAKTREYFAENHIKYVDLDVETSEQGKNGYEQLGGRGVPIVVINNDTVIHGYSPERMTEALSESGK